MDTAKLSACQKNADGRMDGFSAVYSTLASIPGPIVQVLYAYLDCYVSLVFYDLQRLLNAYSIVVCVHTYSHTP